VAIASRLSSEIRGTDQAIRNALDGQALIDTAEGGHNEIENILQRMREIAIQSANDTNDSDDRANLQAEMKALTTEINRVASVTTWAGQKMMQDDGTSFSFQVGTATGSKNQIGITIQSMAADKDGLNLTGVARTAADTTDGAAEVNGVYTKADGKFAIAYASAAVASFDLIMGETPDVPGKTYTFSSTTAMTSGNANRNTVGPEVAAAVNASADMKALGITATYASSDGKVTLAFGITNNVEVESKTTALRAVKHIDVAIKAVNTQRSELGAVSNRLSHTVNNLTNISANLSAAKGGIEDADFAHETTNLAKNQILQQASTAMLAQANAAKQNVLSLLQG
jgi:flagellin